MHDAELVQRVAGTTGLSDAEAARVVDDVLAWYAEPLEDYVRRRHAHTSSTASATPRSSG